MGAAASSNVKWNITLEHERSDENLAIVAGQVLKGKAIAKVEKKPIPPTQISLQLVGKEKTCTVTGSGKHSHRRYGQRTIAWALVVLRDEDGSGEPIQPGVYSYPFRILLPDSLPTSMSHYGRRNTYFTIQYKLILSTKKSGARLTQRRFDVAAVPLPDERVPVVVEPGSYRVKSMGMMNKGSLLLGAKVLDAHVGRGSYIEVFLATRNEATVSIQKVEVSLVEETTWTSGRGRGNSEQRILAQLADVDLPGVIRGKQDKDVVKRQQQSGTEDSEQLEGLYQDLMSGDNKVALKVPYEASDTYKSRLGSVEHYITITMFTKTLVTNPTVRIPLKIGFPPTVPIPSSPVIATTVADPEPRPTVSRQVSVTVPVFNANGIPVAEAVPISTEGVDDCPMAQITSEAFVLGGREEFAEEGQEYEVPIEASAPLAESTTTTTTNATVATLLQEMLVSIRDYDIICNKLKHPEWQEVLRSITTEEYQSIVMHVNVDVDQLYVAVRLARHIGSNFTCSYCVAAINCVSEGYKITIVQHLLPFCTDLPTNHTCIREELTEWEQTATRQDFDRALFVLDRPTR